MRVRRYDAADAAAWDALVDKAPNGTFLHARRFLAYHGDRFADRSVVVLDDGDRLLAVLPAALDPADDRVVVSHPGATYGGLVGTLRGAACVAALAAVRDHYAAAGCTTLRYKAVPAPFHRVPADDDTYALHRLGAVLARCDLGAAVPLDERRYAQGRRTALRHARDAGLVLASGHEHLGAFWPVLAAGLAEQHGAAPTHSLDELLDLVARLPGEIETDVAYEGGTVVAGCVSFRFPAATHTQYLMNAPRGRELSALDLVIDAVLTRAAGRGHRMLSFGVSTEDGGRALNDGLYRYKRSWGAGGVVHAHFELPL